jgi:hypothetical protein
VSGIICLGGFNELHEPSLRRSKFVIAGYLIRIRIVTELLNVIVITIEFNKWTAGSE